MKRFLRILRRWLLLSVILTGMITIGLYAYREIFAYQYDMSFENDADASALAANVKPDTSITNIALFGLDTREDDEIGTRSDCMMILTVDNTHGKVKLTSLMRDSLVTVDEHGQTKLCHAYSYGGPKLAIRTINQNFGMDITEYAAVDFAQLKILIDLVGGIYVDVSEAERREANKFIKEYQTEKGVPTAEQTPILQAGYQHLNGVQAMCYGRIRKGGTGDDWGRVERQSIVLNAMFDQVKEMSVTSMITLMQEMMQYVTTSLSPKEIIPLLVGAVQNGMPEISHTRVPLDSEWEYSSDGVYIKYDLDRAAQLIAAYIYQDIPPEDQLKTNITSVHDVEITDIE